MATPSNSSLRTIQAVDGAAALLKAVADSHQPLTVVELAALTGLNRSTAWRLLATLDQHGLVERDPVTQRYSVGYAILQMAAGGDYDALVRRARPAVERLATATGETASLPVAIVSVWGPEHRVTRERLPEIGKLAVRAADEIKNLLDGNRHASRARAANG